MSKLEVYSYKGNRFPRWAKALLALVGAGVLSFAILLGLVLTGSYDHISGDPQVMIILGCQVRENGPSVLLKDRLDEALGYLEEHPDLTVVVSGGQGPDEPTTEAQAMADYLVERGVEEENILLEGESHNTTQNFQYSKELLSQEDIDCSDGVLVVSNGFHLTRARMLAQRAGFDNVSTLAAPESHLPSRLYMYIREPLALVKSFVFDR
ncbi:YdcF family protein [Lawsonibacter sp. LCP25S3_G6]|uniref:YdcF family protein n=1 Tax=unclassified Lawsonibacter TaxID=2617946 RepID=UPI003F9D3F70